MAAGSAAPERGGFDHLREHSIGLPQVLFQSITHMAPAAAVAYSLFISVPDARQALPPASPVPDRYLRRLRCIGASGSRWPVPWRYLSS